MLLVWRHLLVIDILEAGVIEGRVWSLANQAGEGYEPGVEGGYISAALQVKIPPDVVD